MGTNYLLYCKQIIIATKWFGELINYNMSWYIIIMVVG